jgi:hypothetical protein
LEKVVKKYVSEKLRNDKSNFLKFSSTETDAAPTKLLDTTEKPLSFVKKGFQWTEDYMRNTYGYALVYSKSTIPPLNFIRNNGKRDSLRLKEILKLGFWNDQTEQLRSRVNPKVFLGFEIFKNSIHAL